MILGVTHHLDEKGHPVPVARMTVSHKVSIGRVVETANGKTRPDKLDHFSVQAKNGKGEWIEDGGMMAALKEKYGKQETIKGVKAGEVKVREFEIVLQSDDIEQIFKTEYALWSASARLCHGDGQKARRREDLKPGNDYKPFDDCGEGCPLLESRDCKPSGDLYFMFADRPVIGSVATLHTSSYRSITEITSSLHQLKSLTGGRLMGIPLRIVMRPFRTRYVVNGVAKTGSAFAINIEFRADSDRILPKLVEQSLTYRALPAASIEPVDEDEAANYIQPEFYPEDESQGDSKVVDMPKGLTTEDFTVEEQMEISPYLKSEHGVHNAKQFGQWALRGAGKSQTKEQILADARAFAESLEQVKQ